ncbi:MAG: class I SAM-dependent methyltransferase [Bradymonadia bacterium]
MEPTQDSPIGHACHSFRRAQALSSFSADERFWGIGGTFHYLECPHCHSWTIYPLPSDEMLSHHYAGYYPPEEFAARKKEPINGVERLRAISTYHVLAKLRPLDETHRVLDIGTGCGGFLAAFREQVSVTVAGCDQSEHSAAMAKELFDIPVEVGEFDQLAYAPQSFDVVTMWHCFEHVKAPDVTLRRVKALLKPDGVLVIEVPTQGVWARVFKGRWLFLQAPTHLNIFTQTGLIQKLESNGFEVAKVERPWSPSELAGSLLMRFGLTGFMPRVYFGPKRLLDHLWRVLFVCLLPLDIVLTLISAVTGTSGLLRVFARIESDE